MSQITRCPSCTTKFKVVADQLRISDGWVRCGQCKEVFDASVHLLPAEPQVLLPDVSMAAARPLPTPVAHATDAGRAWGAPTAAVNPAAASVVTMPPVDAHDLPWDSPAPDAVQEVSVPAVPAFLVTGAAAVYSPEMEPTLQAASPFAWRPVVPVSDADLAEGVAPIVDAPASAIPADGGQLPNERASASHLDESLAGYELPSAVLPDTEWIEDVLAEDSAHAANALHPPLDLLRKRSVEEQILGGLGDDGQECVQTHEDGPERVTNTSFDESISPESLSNTGLGRGEELAETSSGGLPPEQEGDDLHEEALDADEVSFVRAAKRKAFWRRPLVRAGLGVVAVVLLCTLVLQAMLQERDRIAATAPRVRPWLQMLCEPFQCALAPLRQISDVVIDSSSFNKGRGDKIGRAHV